MRQVPTYQFLIIGNGRAAKHMRHYLTLNGHYIHQWHYKWSTENSASDLNQDLLQLFNKSDYCLLLIKDSEINGFLTQYPQLRNSKTLHFSGSMEIKGIGNIHPLISFSEPLYDIAFYQNIPFAQFENPQAQLSDFISGISNPCFYISKDQKTLYHGLCVASGNLTVLLWQMVGQMFSDHFHLSHEILKPYLESICQNLTTHWTHALTGPIARKDELTLLKNYEALKNSPLCPILEAHIQSAWPDFYLKHIKQES